MELLAYGVAVMERDLALEAINRALEPLGIKLKAAFNNYEPTATYGYYVSARYEGGDVSIPERFPTNEHECFRTFGDAIDYALYRIIEHYRGGA